MRISLIVPSFYPATVYGGPIYSTLHTCEALAKIQDVVVHVSTTNANMDSRLDVKIGQWQKFEEYFFVKYYNETKINIISLSLFFNVWKDIKNTDVVHAQYMFSSSTPIALIYAKILKKPVILSPRGALCKWCLAQGSQFKYLWLRFLIKPFSSHVLWHATAEQEKQDILLHFPHAKVKTVPNGIEYEKFQTYSRLSPIAFCKKFAKETIEADKIIVSMGRLFKVKGFDILIDSFFKVLNQYPNTVLFIAGPDEGEGENLIKQIKDLALENKVFLVGSVQGQDKIDFLANADLFALPSHTENFGNVYIESLAAGTPIVASTGTPWEEVEFVGCGKWVDNNIIDTSNAIIEMLARDRIGMRYKAKRLAKKYDWENIALQFKNLYEKVC